MNSISAMALKLFPIPFSIFSPPLNQNPYPNQDPKLSPTHQRPATEVRFARWNNANAEKFNEGRRLQQENDVDTPRHRRFTSTANTTSGYDSTTSDNAEIFESTSTASSSSSVPRRNFKYSKPETSTSHPAFRRFSKITNIPKQNDENAISRNANIKISEDGTSYVIDGAPFEFKYSYTETPQVKPLKLREQPFSPFGPTTMPRPWTGRAPLPPSKKKLKEFDSFKLPPPNKKGVKPVQAPGPFLPGSSPRYVKTREEILGEPLTREEVNDLINGCLKSKRQLNMGRDGFTHNMLDNIHAHWKRRRVCKIKCKGVCTVDMDNVCKTLEEKTGGKIIYRKGGVLYLFRGRNYNYRTRPHFPLMLWKPVTPMYPRLIQQAPEGLTVEEAAEMRQKGRALLPICKLAKNGVYCDLIKNVREAFEMGELVRINCQGLNRSDCRKIGAKLKELVPCVLISFELEHILIWRGRDWKSSFIKPENDRERAKESVIDSVTSMESSLEHKGSKLHFIKDANLNALNINTLMLGSEEQLKDVTDTSTKSEVDGREITLDNEAVNNMCADGAVMDGARCGNEMPRATLVETGTTLGLGSKEKRRGVSDGAHAFHDCNITLDNAFNFSVNESEVESSVCGSEAMSDNTRYANEILRGTLVVTNAERTKKFGESKTISDDTGSSAINESKATCNMHGSEAIVDNTGYANEMPMTTSVGSETTEGSVERMEKLLASDGLHDLHESENLTQPCTAEVRRLLKHAVESGSALVLVDANLDADNIYQSAVAFARSAPPGPVFRDRYRKAVVQKFEEESNDSKIELTTVPKKVDLLRQGKTSTVRRAREPNEQLADAVPQGSLGIDELAKLLS